jgi:hypothetical protein
MVELQDIWVEQLNRFSHADMVNADRYGRRHLELYVRGRAVRKAYDICRRRHNLGHLHVPFGANVVIRPRSLLSRRDHPLFSS